MPTRLDDRTEWLEADGCGGYAFGTVNGIRTRRHHAVLAVAAPKGPVLLVHGFEAWVETPGGRTDLTSQRYAGDVVRPGGIRTLVEFTPTPWPAWRFRLPDGSEVEHDLLVGRGRPTVAAGWRLHGGAPGARLCVRLLLSGRPADTLHRENPAFDFAADAREEALAWRPGADGPTLVVTDNGRFTPDPVWYRDLEYAVDRDAGRAHREDLASPGVHTWALDRGAAVLVLDAETADTPIPTNDDDDALARFAALRAAERERRRPRAARLEAAADDYVVHRGGRTAIVTGYPEPAEHARDTFLALRGLCLATGRYDDATRILDGWAGTVSRGMIPDHPAGGDDDDAGTTVDASLWFVIATHELLAATDAAAIVSDATRGRLLAAADAVLDGYAAGSRHGIRVDDDGLLTIGAGAPDVPLTWMDARTADRVVTPRRGKPVEVQALWINALAVGAGRDPRWREPLARAHAAFATRFWDETRGALHDVVDVDGERGRVDATLRPNQILAIGGLPLVLLDALRARRVVDLVERTLLTPFGLRSLGPREPGYRPDGGGDAIHQGPAWPWLLGPFVEAWVRVHGDDDAARAEARVRFLEPLVGHLDEGGVGHVAERFDAEPPYRPRGRPMDARSAGELLRLQRRVLTLTRRNAATP